MYKFFPLVMFYFKNIDLKKLIDDYGYALKHHGIAFQCFSIYTFSKNHVKKKIRI